MRNISDLVEVQVHANRSDTLGKHREDMPAINYKPGQVYIVERQYLEEYDWLEEVGSVDEDEADEADDSEPSSSEPEEGEEEEGGSEDTVPEYELPIDEDDHLKDDLLDIATHLGIDAHYGMTKPEIADAINE